MKEIRRLKAMIRLMIELMQKHSYTKEAVADLRFMQQKLRRLEQQVFK